VAEVTEPTYTSEELADGLHVLEVTSVDDLGNESARSTVGHVLIDTKPPADPIMFDLEPFTNGNLHDSVTLVWTAVDDATRYTVEWWSEKASTSSLPKTRVVEVPTLTIDISGVEDGWTVFARVKAHDAVDNQSGWSNRVSTTIDDRGPAVTITNPAEAVTTNAATFTYEWTAEDDGSGVDYCTVVFNGGEHRVETPIESEPEVGSLNGESPVRTYAWTGTLIKGDNTFKVWATDKLGNKSEIVAVAPVVTQVLPQIVLVQPMPGAEYKINEISTIAFEVIGLVVDDDDQYLKPEVLLNGVKLDAWRIVSVVPPPVAKFYILLDNDVMAPGTMAIRITIGAGSELFIYAVDSERSGFGFGRLRPW